MLSMIKHYSKKGGWYDSMCKNSILPIVSKGGWCDFPCKWYFVKNTHPKGCIPHQYC